MFVILSYIIFRFTSSQRESPFDRWISANRISTFLLRNNNVRLKNYPNGWPRLSNYTHFHETFRRFWWIIRNLISLGRSTWSGLWFFSFYIYHRRFFADSRSWPKANGSNMYFCWFSWPFYHISHRNNQICSLGQYTFSNYQKHSPDLWPRSSNYSCFRSEKSYFCIFRILSPLMFLLEKSTKSLRGYFIFWRLPMTSRWDCSKINGSLLG